MFGTRSNSFPMRATKSPRRASGGISERSIVLLEGGQLPGVGVLEQRQEEVLLVLEVRIHRALRESGDRRDLVKGRPVEPTLGEDLRRSLEQVVAGLLAPTFWGERFEGHGLCYLRV